jgi:acetolactate synthase-1/2/3 large subunit
MVALLCEQGVDTFFGIPGGPVIPVFDAILTHPVARLVEPRHETTGAFAAMGYHRASGRVPAIVVTAGPGSTNLVTGVTAAHLERVPLVAICGDVAWAATGQRMTQDTGIYGIGVERILERICRRVVRIRHGGSVRGQVEEALARATSPEDPGPVAILFSVDHAGGPAPAGELYRAPPRPHVARIDPLVIEDIALRLRMSQRPLLFLGAAARRHHATMAALVDALGIPFVTTPQGKGVVSEDHPLSLRTCGMAGSTWARRYLKAGAEATLVLGTDLDDAATAGSPPVGPSGFLVHVDDEGEHLGRNFPTAIGVLADIGVFADQLVEALSGEPPSVHGLRAIADVKRGSPFDEPGFQTDEALPVAPHRVIADLERAAPPGTRFVSDVGEHMLFALHYLTVTDPSRFTIHLGLGSMGSGIGSAIGQALADPGTPVVCVCGDGGMEMVGMEILVAVKHRLPIVYAVFNDARYNMVYHGYRHTFGREAGWYTPPVDFVQWAQSIGAQGVRIDRPGQIDAPLIQALLARGGPAVLDIRQDRDRRIRGEGRIEAIRQMSLLHRPGP